MRLVAFALALLLSGALPAQPLFDTHLHYSAEDAAAFAPAEILAILDRNDIAHAVVTGTPATHTEALFRYAPARIVPFLGVYRSDADKIPWPQDAGLPARVEQALDNGIWRGLGELHIFAEDRASPVFRRLVELAAARDLPLLMHADPEVIDTLFAIAPQATVLWAHAGTEPRPALLAEYLERYPRLSVDLSVRDERIAPEGQLAEDWRALFLAHPERFLVGVDTFSVNRWRAFDSVAARIRAWLAQLPPEVAAQLAYGNAAALFKPLPQYLCH
ncbi:MAG: amidohydrolase family protein [Gammaproteobacteria bacterium]